MSWNETSDHAGRQIEQLIDALEVLDDPRARSQAQELLRVILDLHLVGLKRLMEIVGGTGEAGRAIIEAVAEDPKVSPILLLHGLHPQDLAVRVRQAVEKMSPFLGAQGIAIDLVSVTEDVVKLRLSGNWTGQKLQVKALERDIEEALFERAPEVMQVMIDGLPAADWQVIHFVGLPTQGGTGYGR